MGYSSWGCKKSNTIERLNQWQLGARHSAGRCGHCQPSGSEHLWAESSHASEEGKAGVRCAGDRGDPWVLGWEWNDRAASRVLLRQCHGWFLPLQWGSVVLGPQGAGESPTSLQRQENSSC